MPIVFKQEGKPSALRFLKTFPLTFIASLAVAAISYKAATEAYKHYGAINPPVARLAATIATGGLVSRILLGVTPKLDNPTMGEEVTSFALAAYDKFTKSDRQDGRTTEDQSSHQNQGARAGVQGSPESLGGAETAVSSTEQPTKRIDSDLPFRGRRFVSNQPGDSPQPGDVG